MNLMFSDIAGAFASVMQKDMPKEGFLNTDTSGAQKPGFADHLKKQMEKSDAKGDSPLQAIKGMFQTDPQLSAASPSLVDKLSQGSGEDTIPALNTVLLKLSKGNLNNLAIDAGGLEILRKILLTKGYSNADLDEVFAGLFEKTKTGKIPISDVMSRLSDFSLKKKPSDKEGSESFFQISALPFLESLLNSLGLKQQEIKQIMDEATKDDKGISLDVVLEKLKALQKNAAYTNRSFETVKSDKNYEALIKQLGLEQDENPQAAFTLNGFVNALEKLQKKISLDKMPPEGLSASEAPHRTTPVQETADLFAELFKGLEQVEKSEKPLNAGWAYEQIKNQVGNKLVLPAEKNIVENSLFSTGKDMVQGLEVKSKLADKQIEAILGQKKNADMDPAGLQKEAKAVIRQLKTEGSKFIDQLQLAGTDTKSQDIYAGAGELRSKPALRELPVHVTQQVTKGLVRAINQGEPVLRLQLKPPELGRLVMTIDNTGSQMKISIITENQAARDILVSNMTDIRTSLSNSGVNLERFEVDMSSNFQQSMADARNQAGNPGKRHSGNGRSMDSAITGIDADDPSRLQVHINPDGSLHYVA